MMIKVNVNCDEYNKRFYSRDYEVIDISDLPKDGIGEKYNSELIESFEEADTDPEQSDSEYMNYSYYDIVTYASDDPDDLHYYYVAVDSEADYRRSVKADCTGKTWAWCLRDEAYKMEILDGMTAIDGTTGNEMTESGDCIVDLGLGLSVAGHYIAEKDEIVIDNEAIVYDPENPVNPFRVIREQLGWTQAQLVGHFRGMSVRTWQDWEADRRKPPQYVQDLILEKLNTFVK